MSDDLPPPPPERRASPPPPPPAGTPPPLPAESAGPARHSDPAAGGLGVLIPAKNPHSLWSYYLGIFSFFPCLGLAMGITAVILGVIAIKRFNANPAIRGRTHAIVGIVGGSLGALINLVLIVLFVMNLPH